MDTWIAIVDADAAMRDQVQNWLVAEGYRTLVSSECKTAYLQIYRAQPDLVILNFWLEHPTAGIMLLRLLRIDPATRTIPVVICTPLDRLRPDQLSQLQKCGYRVLTHPFTHEALLAQVGQALADPRRHQQAPDRELPEGR